MVNMFYGALANILAGAMANDKANVKMQINGKDVDAVDLFRDLETLASKYAPEDKEVCGKCGNDPCTCENTEGCKKSVVEDAKVGCEPMEDKYTTTYSAPIAKLQEDTKVCKAQSADDMLEDEESDGIEELTCDIDKMTDAEIYICKPFVAGMESADDPIIIPFASYTNGKAITGVTDEQLVAILANRYRFDEERFKIVMQLIQTYYGK